MNKILIILTVLLIPMLVSAGYCPLCGEATEAKQDSIIVDTGTIAGDTTSIDGKIPSGPATVTKQDETKALIGEVQASPTSNTMLDRLKQIEDNQTDKSQFCKITDVAGFSAIIDSKSNAFVDIDAEHHFVHDGKSYTVNYHNDVTNQNEQTVIGFNVPSGTNRVHMIIEASVTSVATISLYENPSIDNGEGTEINPFNRDRNSVNTSILQSVEASPTANEVTTYDETQAAGANITTTTEILHEHIGQTGNPQTKSGGMVRGRVEIILENNQQYAIVINADDANDNHHSITLNWYESVDSN